MTKAQLIEQIAQKTGRQMNDAETLVNTVFDAMVNALVEDQRIELRGFGTFVNRSYESYTGRNPKTGQSVTVPPKKIPFFRVGKDLKKMVDSGSKS